LIDEIKLFDTWRTIPEIIPSSTTTIENWYVEPFTKRKGCNVPGQCGGDCDCGCPYNNMTELEQLPEIATIATIFPDEWLAFIISPAEDEAFEPTHGKLVAHSPIPNEIYDAINTILWNQHVYIFFNGSFEAMQASYGNQWAEVTAVPPKRVASGPKPIEASTKPTASPPPLPDDIIDLIYSAVDQLYDIPNLNEAIRRLRLAQVRANRQANPPLTAMLNEALDMLEGSLPRVDEVVWFIEESLSELYP